MMQESDIPVIRELWEDQYKDHEFPDFTQNFYSSFVITDDDGAIITCGGVKAVAEAAIFTDKNKPPLERRTALIQLMGAMFFIAAANNQDQLYAFVHDLEDESWFKALENYGFKRNKDALFIKDV